MSVAVVFAHEQLGTVHTAKSGFTAALTEDTHTVLRIATVHTATPPTVTAMRARVAKAASELADTAARAVLVHTETVFFRAVLALETVHTEASTVRAHPITRAVLRAGVIFSEVFACFAVEASVAVTLIFITETTATAIMLTGCTQFAMLTLKSHITEAMPILACPMITTSTTATPILVTTVFTKIPWLTNTLP